MKESEVVPGRLLYREDAGTIRGFTGKDPGVDRAAVAQRKVCDAVYPFEFPHAVDAQPFVLAEQVGGAYPFHEGPVADTK